MEEANTIIPIVPWLLFQSQLKILLEGKFHLSLLLFTTYIIQYNYIGLNCSPKALSIYSTNNCWVYSVFQA